MMKKYIWLSFFLIPSFSYSFFSNNLSLGSTGSDVLELQRMLNTDSSTQIASFGPGSPGNETNYFGQLTKSAVIKFQNKYKEEVLDPIGLTTGTGFVGLQTRNKLNILNSNLAQNQASNSNYLNISPPPPPVDVIQTQKTEVKSSNVIKKTELENGINSNDIKFSTSMKIESISPVSGKPGTKVTIKGYGFSNLNNQIYTGYSIIDNVPSKDGKTLVFNIESPFTSDEYRASGPGYNDLTVPLGIFIRNNTGVSNHKMFKMSF